MCQDSQKGHKFVPVKGTFFGNQIVVHKNLGLKSQNSYFPQASKGPWGTLAFTTERWKREPPQTKTRLWTTILQGCIPISDLKINTDVKNKHTLSVLCITPHSRKYKLLVISRQMWQNIMMETPETGRMEADHYKLEGTHRDHRVQLPALAGQPKTK